MDNLPKNKMVINHFKLRGKAKYVFSMLKILATTEPIEQDKNWWRARAYVLANDRDMMARQLSIANRLSMRNN